jgi:hypothetical protein
LVGGAASDLIGGVHEVDYRRGAVPIWHTGRADRSDATLGGCFPGVGYARVEAMISTVLAHMEMSNAGFTHDRRPSLNVGYRVWNPFEVELRTSVDGQYDQVAQGLTLASSVVK